MGTTNNNSGSNSGGPSSASQYYIDHLKKDLEAAKLCLDEACAVSDKAREEYSDAQKWEILLKAYFDRIDTTLNLAGKVLMLLESTKGQASIVCGNIKSTVQAIQILIMEVKETSECVEELKGKIKTLLDLIDCLNDPALDPQTSILKCIMALKAAVDEALKASLDAIKTVLEVLKTLNHLLHMICDSVLVGPGPQDNGHIEDSLIKNLEALMELIQCGRITSSGELPPGAAGRVSDDQPENTQGSGKIRKSSAAAVKVKSKGGITAEMDCEKIKASDPGCEIESKPCFCINENANPDCQGDCSTEAYYNETKAMQEEAKALLNYKKCLLEKAEDAKNRAQSQYDAIKGALEAAIAAKDC